jgi:hypothetical protein
MLIQASVNNPPAFEHDYDRRLKGPDHGLINAWIAGIRYAKEHPDLAARAQAGELPVLPYRGGVERSIKTRNKIGALQYVAMWQGLRHQDLHLDTESEPVMTCQRTGVPVTFTLDIKKLFAQTETEQP